MKKYLLTALSALIMLTAAAQNTGIGTISPTDQLHTTGTVRFEGYRGPGTRLMQVDSSGRMIVTGAGSVFVVTPGLAVTDNGCGSGNGVLSAITVSGQATAISSSKIAVRLNITHPADNDLRLLLTAPNGATLLLMAGTSFAGANLTNTIFTDAAVGNITGAAYSAPYTGKFKPTGGLVAVCQQTPTVTSFGAIGGGTIVPNGAWTLKVYDGATGNTGTLNSWSISFSGPESFITAEQNNFLPKFNAGNLDASAVYQNPSTGNVGINTSNPTYPLTLAGTGGNGIVQQDNADGVEIGTYANSAGGWLQTYTNHPLLFTTNNGGAKMALSTAGDVGIGLAANLLARLHILSSGPSLLQLENNGAMSSTSTVDMAFKNGTFYSGLIRTRGTSSNTSALGFYTYAATALSAMTERLTILDGGNVGIGNTAPAYNLDVAGNMHTTGLAYFGGNVGVGNATPAYTVDINGTLHSTGQALIGGTLSINGQTNVNGNISINGQATVNSNLRITPGTPAPVKVLTATNASGDAAWQYPPQYNTGMQAHNATYKLWYDLATVYADSLTEDFDHGNNFDPVTGTYTAPATGTYQYSFTISGTSGEPTNPSSQVLLFCRVIVNGAQAQEFRTDLVHGAGWPFSRSVTTLLNLAAGSTVRLQLQMFNVCYYGSCPLTNDIMANNTLINCYRIY